MRSLCLFTLPIGVHEMKRIWFIGILIGAALLFMNTNAATSVNSPPPPNLAAPSNATNNAPLALSLSWGSAAGATSYAIEISTSSTFASTLSLQTGVTVLYSNVSGLTNSTTYFWRACSVNDSGPGPMVGSLELYHALVGVPVVYSPPNNSINQPISLNLSWNGVAGAASYSLQVSSVLDFSTTVVYQSGLTAFHFSVGPLSNNTAYYWQVNAMNAGGSGDWSKAWGFVTIVAAPTPPALSMPTNGTNGLSNAPLTLTWILAGNTADSTTLRDFLDRIERQYGKARRIWVMDRGIPTEAVLEEMRRADPPVCYLVGTPKGRLSRLEQDLPGRPWHAVPTRRAGEAVARRWRTLCLCRKPGSRRQGTRHAPATVEVAMGAPQATLGHAPQPRRAAHEARRRARQSSDRLAPGRDRVARARPARRSRPLSLTGSIATNCE